LNLRKGIAVAGTPAIEHAVIIAGGRGTRMLPATRALPKEFLTVADRPLIQHAVEEAVACGARRIVIVASPRSLPMMREHFAPLTEAERQEPRLASIRAIQERAEVVFAVQERADGTGPATLLAEPLVEGARFLLILPDILYTPASPGPELAATAARLGGGSVIAVRRVTPEAYDRYGLVEGEAVEDGTVRLRAVDEKPGTRYTAPSALGITGRYLLEPGIFGALRATPPGVGGEVHITDAIALLAAREPVFARTCEGDHYDAGNPVGFMAGSLARALEDPALRGALRDAVTPIIDAAREG
jgi:UTP--glucose-1-phosphate uridylyltransferase